jgi:uncharacterized membrane protein HdeD (DUF308 family)
MKNWMIWFTAGILSVIAGLVALTNPLAATIAAELIAGWAFLVIGLFTGYVAYQEDTSKDRIWGLLTAIGIALVGTTLLYNPLAGILSLTLIVGLLFLVTGVSKVLLAFADREHREFWAILASGLLSIVLAVMVFANFPQSAASILGIVLGVELISNGVSLVAMSIRRRHEENRTPKHAAV